MGVESYFFINEFSLEFLGEMRKLLLIILLIKELLFSYVGDIIKLFVDFR